MSPESWIHHLPRTRSSKQPSQKTFVCDSNMNRRERDPRAAEKLWSRSYMVICRSQPHQILPGLFPILCETRPRTRARWCSAWALLYWHIWYNQYPALLAQHETSAISPNKMLWRCIIHVKQVACTRIRQQIPWYLVYHNRAWKETSARGEFAIVVSDCACVLKPQSEKNT